VHFEAASHFAAESSTGTNVEVSTTDDYTRGLDALVSDAEETTGNLRIDFPLELFDRNMIDFNVLEGARSFESFPQDAGSLFPG